MNSWCWHPAGTQRGEEISPRLAIPVPRLDARVGQARAVPAGKTRRLRNTEKPTVSREPYICIIERYPERRIRPHLQSCGHRGREDEAHAKCRPNASAISDRGPGTTRAVPCDQNGS